MTKKIVNWALSLLALALVITFIINAINKHEDTQKDNAVAVSVPLELTTSSSIDGLKIGLIITIGDTSAEGSQWNKAAAGAQVAIERFNRSGRNITLITHDDQGTAEGTANAVKALKNQEVSGIIIASSGPHLAEGITAAQEADIPVILPYQESTGDAWSLAPATTQITEHATKYTKHSARTYLIQQEGRSTPYTAHETHTYTPGTDPHEFLAPIAEYVKRDEHKNNTYSLIIDADAYVLSTLTRAIQENGIHANILLSYDATSPALSVALTNNGPSTGPALNATTIGHNIDDAVALQPDPAGRSMSAYLQMINVMNAENIPATYGDQPFTELANSADARTHDSVIAIVKAAEQAKSKKPTDITAALKTLELTPSDGITAPSYNFTQQQAANYPPALLHPSTGNLNLRTNTTHQRIIWFAEEQK